MKTEEQHFADRLVCLSNWLSAKEYTGSGESEEREREVPGCCIENIQENICHCSNDNKQTYKAYLSTHVLIRVLKT